MVPECTAQVIKWLVNNSSPAMQLKHKEIGAWLIINVK
jgi:hypothetical protein